MLGPTDHPWIEPAFARPGHDQDKRNGGESPSAFNANLPETFYDRFVRARFFFCEAFGKKPPMQGD